MIALPTIPDIIHLPSFFAPDEAMYYLNKLSAEIEFKPETYVFNNEIIQTKRKISFHSTKAYSYSNQNYPGKAWNDVLIEIKNIIEERTGYDFNGVLCNSYENGEAGMGWHADKEKELGSQPVIASISFGQSRRFAFRHRKELVSLKNPPRLIEYLLNSGDLFIMKGNTQDIFEHSLIKDKSANDLRINLTYRKIIT